MLDTAAADVLLSQGSLCGHGVLVYTNNTGKLLIALECHRGEKPDSVSLSKLLLALLVTTSPSWLITVLTVILVKRKGHCRSAYI